MQYDNTNSGTFGKNRNPKSDKSPDYTGRINLLGADFWLSGWVKEDFLTDEQYFSLALNRKDDRDCKATGKITRNAGAIGNQPEFVGTIKVDSNEFKIACWQRSSNDGNKFLSLKATFMDGQVDPNVARPQPTKHEPAKPTQHSEPAMDFDDDIPF